MTARVHSNLRARLLAPHAAREFVLVALLEAFRQACLLREVSLRQLVDGARAHAALEPARVTGLADPMLFLQLSLGLIDAESYACLESMAVLEQQRALQRATGRAGKPLRVLAVETPQFVHPRLCLVERGASARQFPCGLLLAPLGIVNELHEPTNFLAANRSQTEARIIPTTWRALGAGVFGEAGGFEWRAYGINSLDGDEFSAAGLRGGRQKGNRAAADDFGVAARLDYTGWDGITVGASAFHGKTGQDGLDDMAVAIPGLDTTILEVHGEVELGPFEARGLYARALVDDAGSFNAATGERLARMLEGYYVEAGVDVFSLLGVDTAVRMTPYVRYEQIDTQARMPAGFTADPSRDNQIWTVGVQLKPIQNIVLKIDYSDWDGADDRFAVLLGYIF